jgi:hypothetical protein
MKSARGYPERIQGTRATLSVKMLVALVILGMSVAGAGCGDTGTPATPTLEAKATATTLVEETTTEPTKGSSDGWITFASEADGFSVDMPGEPKTSTQTADSPLGEITFYFFQLADGNAQYIVSYSDYPVAAEELNAEQVLNDAVKGAAQGGEMENVQTVDVQGNAGMEGETTLQGQHVWYRAILAKNRLYQLIMSAPQADKEALAHEARRFINSFMLLKPR